MITHDFSVSRETFAAARKQILTDAEEALRPHIKEALTRVGLPSWEYQIVQAALDVFDVTARAEIDAWSQVIDDLRDAFALELGRALAPTTKASSAERQLDTITRWVASAAHNAAMEAATSADPDGNVGLEWVTMGDGNVRDSHSEANGQQVPTGSPFTVDGTELLYPGQPVGDPSVWINCRCLARPAMLDSELTATTITAAANPDAGDQVVEEEITSTVIVALPAAEDPISAASSERSGAHATLLFLGDSSQLDEAALNAAVQEFVTAGEVGIITEQVNGRATLGKDAADVVLFDAANLVFIRDGLLQNSPVLQEVYSSVEQFPTWLPHVTLGYPAKPALAEYAGETITFDRLAVWHGESRTEYPLGGAIVPAEEPKKDVIHPEGDGFTQQMADEFVASVPEKKPEVTEEVPAVAPAGEPEELRRWHGVLAPEGAPSGDRRGFAARMLTMRDLPLPLKFQYEDEEGHNGSVPVGRIDEVYRDGGLIRASGVWHNSEDANKAYDLIEKKIIRGVSVDLDAAEGEVVQAAEEGGRESIEFTQGRICSATLCAIPAFAEAFVRNGTWEEFANEPLPTGAMVEIPDWPAVALVASAAVAPVSVEYFRNPMLTELTPVTLGEDGHIFGHLAGWQTCHVAYEVCTTAPPSETDYAFFLTGQVFTDAGPVAVGQLTVGGGHADGKLGVRAAMAHYDNVATAVADITVFDDEHGIAFSGRIRPWATEQQVHELLAAGPSGDWRMVRHKGRDSMEMIAAHAVNVQGFPVPRTRFAVEGGRQVSLVAAGIVDRDGVAERMERLQKVEAAMSKIRRVQFNRLDKKIKSLKGM